MRHLKKYLLIKDRILVLIILILFIYICGSNAAKGTVLGFSATEYVLFCLTDHYYLMYAWFFFIVFWSVRRIREKSSLQKVRQVSYKKMYIIHLAEISANVAVILILHLVIAFVIGMINFDETAGFRAVMNFPEASELEVVATYKDAFNFSGLSLFCATCYMWLGSVMIYMILYFASEIWSKKGTIVSAVLLIISAMVGFNTGIDEGLFAFGFVNNWFILHHGLLVAGESAFLLELVVMVVISCALTVIALKHNRNIRGVKYFGNLFKARKRVFWLYIIVVSLMSVIPLFGGDVTGRDIIWKLMSGFSYENFNLTEFLFYMALPVFPLFFINASWQSEIRNRQEIALIRTGSMSVWRRLRLKENIKYIFKYYSAYLIVTLIMIVGSVAVFGGETSSTASGIPGDFSVPEGQLTMPILSSFILRFFEICILYYLDRLIFCITGNTVVAFFGSMAIYIPCLLMGSSGFLIFGKGSLQQLCLLFSENNFGFLIFLILVNAGLPILIWFVEKSEIFITISQRLKKKKAYENNFKETRYE